MPYSYLNQADTVATSTPEEKGYRKLLQEVLCSLKQLLYKPNPVTYLSGV